MVAPVFTFIIIDSFIMISSYPLDPEVYERLFLAHKGLIILLVNGYSIAVPDLQK